MTLTLSDNDSSEVLYPSSLVFSTGNWSTAQTVTLTGKDDLIIDGNQTTLLTLTPSSADSNYNSPGLAAQTVTVTTSDDDSASFTLSKTTASVAETGTTDTFTVVLNSQPSANVTLTLSDNDSSEILYSSSLVFSTGNWSTAQTVTLTGKDDSIVDGNQTTLLTLTPSSGDGNYNSPTLSAQTVTVTTSDDDSAGFTLSKTTASVAETGTTDTFTVVLDSQPSANVTLTLSDNDSSEVLYSSSLVFSTGNWSTAQTVTLTGKDDSIIDGNQTTLLTLTPSSGDGNYNSPGLAAQTVTVTTSDDDSASFTLSKTTASVAETGTTDTFTVVLNSQPSANVTLTLSDNDSSEVLYPSSVVFSTGNWSTAQTVTLTGKDDSIVDGNQTTLLTLTPSSADSNYSSPGLSAQTVTVTTSDDDSAGFTLSKTTASVSETGTTDTFTVVSPLE